MLMSEEGYPDFNISPNPWSLAVEGDVTIPPMYVTPAIETQKAWMSKGFQGLGGEFKDNYPLVKIGVLAGLGWVIYKFVKGRK